MGNKYLQYNNKFAGWNGNPMQIDVPGGGGSYPTDGLTHYWGIDETSGTDIADSVGSFNGTLYNGSLNASGKNEYCLSWNSAANSAIRMGDVLSVEKATTYSTSLWWKLDTASDPGEGFLIGKAMSSSPYKGWIYHFSWSTHIYWDIFASSGSNQQRIAADDNLTGDTDWHHFVATYDGTDATGMLMYIDGTLADTTISTNNLSDSTYNSAAQFTIGNRTTSSSAFKGRIDEVGYWNRVLTSDEVATLWNDGDGLFYS